MDNVSPGLGLSICDDTVARTTVETIERDNDNVAYTIKGIY